MRPRRRLLVPAAMSVLALAALAFAIVATLESGSGRSTPQAPAGTSSEGAGGAAGGGQASGAAGSGQAPGAAGSGQAPGAADGQAPVATGAFDGAPLPPGVTAPAFTLRSEAGGRVSLRSLRGKPVLLAFLYSRCGGPCFLIAQQIRGALDEVGEAARAVIVSADPAGDTPGRVRAFLASASLEGRALYLTGTAAQLRAVWSAYRVKPASAGRATFAQYVTVLLIDARGDERVLYGREQLTPEALAHDIRRLQGG